MSTEFVGLVIIGERFENSLKSGKIGKSPPSQNSNKRYSSNINPKKGEINADVIEGHS